MFLRGALRVRNRKERIFAVLREPVGARSLRFIEGMEVFGLPKPA